MASVAVSQPNTSIPSQKSDVPTETSPQTEPQCLPDEGEQLEDKENEKNDKEQPKPKIFDKKNFVEAPIPKTNPWGKTVVAAAPVAKGVMKQTESNQPKVIKASPTSTKASDFTDATNWPTLNEVVENKPAKGPQPVKPATPPQTSSPVITKSAPEPAKKEAEPQPVPPAQNSKSSSSDSGGEDSSKENKDTANTESAKAKAKKKGNNKQKWVPLDIDHPKERSGRKPPRGRDREGGHVPPRRERRRPERAEGEGGEKHEGQGSSSKNWREDMRPTSPQSDHGGDRRGRGGYRGARRGRGRGRGGRGGRGGGPGREHFGGGDFPFVPSTGEEQFFMDPAQAPFFRAPMFFPGMNSALNSALPYNPVDETILLDFVRKQIDYYFSEENLQRDFFLRRKMNKGGWIPISLIASFHRVQALTQDVNLIIKAMKNSAEVTTSDDLLRMKPKVEGDKWPIDGLNIPFSNLKVDVPEFVPGQAYTVKPTEQTESAPTSPFIQGDGDASSSKKSAKTREPAHLDYSQYTMPVLSSSAPELEGNWTEVKRKMRGPTPKTTPKKEEMKEGDGDVDELDFMFDEELDNFKGTSRTNTFTDWSDDSDAEIDDQIVSRILIVTQTPPSLRKHPGGDRTGDFLPRSKMSADFAKIINDGLKHYEQDIVDQELQQHDFEQYKTVNVITKEEFETIHPSQAPVEPNQKVPPPPPSIPLPKAASKIDVAHSMPSNVPVAVGIDNVPRTPRTPRNKDETGPRFYPVVKDTTKVDPQTPRKRKTRHGKNPPVESHVGWMLDAKEHHPRYRTSSESMAGMSPLEGGLSASVGSLPHSFVPFEHPSHQLLKESGFVWCVYHKYHAKALKERKKLGVGRSQEMNTLFRFWSFFLRQH